MILNLSLPDISRMKFSRCTTNYLSLGLLNFLHHRQATFQTREGSFSSESYGFIPRVTQTFEQVFPSALYFVLLVSEPFHCLQLWRTKAGLLCNNISRMKIAFSLPVITLPSILDFLALIYNSKGNITYCQGAITEKKMQF